MRLPAYRELDPEQDLIYNLPLHLSCLVSGPPGTGKTVMALYRASALKKNSEPIKLIMYGVPLSSYTSNVAAELELGDAVDTYHSWFSKLYLQTYGRFCPQVEPYHPDWNVVIPQLNNRPLRGSGQNNLLIDEGQDLEPQFYFVARAYAKNLTVFGDENQQITATNSTLADILSWGNIPAEHHYKLRKNHRNTREIAAVAAHFYVGLKTGIPDLPTRSRVRPQMARNANIQDAVTQIARFARNNADLQIGVFVPNRSLLNSFTSRLQSELSDLTSNTKANFKVQKYYSKSRDHVDFTAAGVFVLCYPSVKGLEFEAVFLPELQSSPIGDDDTRFRMLFYVMASRAREYLYFSFSGVETPRILDYFPKELMEWQI